MIKNIKKKNKYMKSIKITKFTKKYKIWVMEFVHNTKSKNIFDFRKIKQIESILAFVGVFVKQIVILNIGYGFCVFNSIWEHR